MKPILRVRLSRRALVATLAAGALAALASQSIASEDAALELFHGPNESQGLVLQALRAELDGKELPVRLPSAGANPGSPVYQGAIAPGTHNLQVEAEYTGDSSVFSYVEGFRFRMRGQLEVKADAGDVVSVQSRVHSRLGLTVQWQDRYSLSLSGTVRRGAKPVEAAPVPLVASAPAAAEPSQAPLPPPSVPVAPPAPERATCTLNPVRFDFGKATLDGAAVAALDEYAACLAGNGAAVRLVGYCDQRGSDEYNLRLGEKRAASAASRLRKKGVAAGRISVRSLGKSNPLCADATEACYARNRRVEAVPIQ